MSMTAYVYSSVQLSVTQLMSQRMLTHARRAKGNPVPIPEPGSGTAYNSGPRKSVRRGNPK